MTRTVRLALRCTLLSLAFAPAVARAQACAQASGDSGVTARRWPPPLDRPISLNEHGVVYVDGIEVANSLLVTELGVESVERVEVIRGRQGAFKRVRDFQGVRALEFEMPECSTLLEFKGSDPLESLLKIISTSRLATSWR